MRLIARANSTDGCVATLGFKDAAGRLIGPHANVELKAGEVHVLDFNPDVPQNDKPLLLLPAVQTELKTATGAPVSSACLVTSEVFNFRTGIPGTYQEALIH